MAYSDGDLPFDLLMAPDGDPECIRGADHKRVQPDLFILQDHGEEPLLAMEMKAGNKGPQHDL